MPPGESIAAWLASLPPEEREAQLRELAPTEAERAALEYSWAFWARPDQLAPEGDWSTWLCLAGRGWGKTRTGAEWVRGEVENGARRFALVGRTTADVRDVMVEGESGLLATSPPWNRPTWVASKRRLTWPNGAIATTYSADKPDQLRGPQHDRAWCDELAAWRYQAETWANLQMGLRLGDRPRACVTTTPRSTKLVKELRDDPSTRLATGTTYDNSGNLPRAYLEAILRRYEGTRIGMQELLARVLDDTPGALWTRALLEACRLTSKQAPKPKDLRRIVVAVDPQVADPTKKPDDEEGCETGIVVVGLGALDKAYLLEDLSGQYAPAEWAKRVADAYALWQADLVVAEANNGGALVESNLRGHDDAKNLPVKLVHASRGKRARAEPVSTLYEQKRVLHVGAFPELEDQLCTWDASSSARSPDRLDALVWGVTELMLDSLAPDDLHVDRLRLRR